MTQAKSLRVGVIGYGLAGVVFYAPLFAVTVDAIVRRANTRSGR